MMSPTRIILLALAAIVLGSLCWNRVAKFTGQRRTLTEAIEQSTGMYEQRALTLEGRGVLDEALASIRNRTLGGSVEIVDHRLRTRLNRLVEEVSLKKAQVSTSGAVVVTSPARSALPRRGPWKALRDEPDFVRVDASVSGEGSLAQALQMIHRLEGEPWIKRIRSVKLDPQENGNRVVLTVRLSTLFLPGGEPHTVAESEYDPASFQRYATLVGANPFRVPPDPPPPTVQAPVAKPEPKRFPYGQWRLTGVADGVDGSEVWLRNSKSGESRRLIVGESLHQATFMSIVGDAAIFRIGEELFRVAVGNHLNNRTPFREESSPPGR